MILLYIIGLTVLGGIVGLLAAFFIVVRLAKDPERLMHLVSFAAGAMLSAAFFDLLPEAFEHLGEAKFGLGFLYVFGGFLLFYVIEQFLLISHCHEGICDVHKARRSMVIIGDTVHNFLDGIAIAAALLISLPLGFVTAIAVFFHEIPQEIGDFAVLQRMGMTRAQAIRWNLFSACATIVGGVLTYLIVGAVESIEVLLIALAGGGFIYIATVDLLPEVHKEMRRGHILSHMFAFGLGVVVLWVLNATLHV
ncbi:MAG: ZIP family metal transporter [bacterium]|nr:ZIP family metal transporter [bacterium]